MSSYVSWCIECLQKIQVKFEPLAAAPPTTHAFRSRERWFRLDRGKIRDSVRLIASQIVSCEWMNEQLDGKSPNLKILDGKWL